MNSLGSWDVSSQGMQVHRVEVRYWCTADGGSIGGKREVWEVDRWDRGSGAINGRRAAITPAFAVLTDFRDTVQGTNLDNTSQVFSGKRLQAKNPHLLWSVSSFGASARRKVGDAVTSRLTLRRQRLGLLGHSPPCGS